VSHHEQFVVILLVACSTQKYDEVILMEEAMAAIRRAMADEEAGEMTSTSASRVAEAELLSRDATAAIGSAFNTLTETVKQHQPSLEDVVRETLRPMLKSWLDENLPGVVERMVQAEIERITRGV
jgi:cell pole-organizing protein PopZ